MARRRGTSKSNSCAESLPLAAFICTTIALLSTAPAYAETLSAGDIVAFGTVNGTLYRIYLITGVLHDTC